MAGAPGGVDEQRFLLGHGALLRMSFVVDHFRRQVVNVYDEIRFSLVYIARRPRERVLVDRSQLGPTPRPALPAVGSTNSISTTKLAWWHRLCMCMQ